MSLDWNVENVLNYEMLCWEDVKDPLTGRVTTRVNPVTEQLVFATMLIGIEAIQYKTVDKFVDRLDRWQDAKGALLIEWKEEWDKPRPLRVTREDVEAHVGLRTNASRLSETEFKKRLAA